jgi:hypothetical protein
VAGETGQVLGAVEGGEFLPPRQLDTTIDRALESVSLSFPRDPFARSKSIEPPDLPQPQERCSWAPGLV